MNAAKIHIKSPLWTLMRRYGMMRLSYLSRVCKQMGSKIGSGGILVTREPKWDLCLETQGKCNQASREPEQVPLGAKLASQCMLRLTLPCAQVAQAELRPSLGRAQEYSTSAQVKAAAAHV